MQLEYAEIVFKNPVQKFLVKFLYSNDHIQKLIIISPYIGALEGAKVSLDSVCKRVTQKRIPTYVITRSPREEYQKKAVDTFLNYDIIEMRYNESLHAKLYICLCQDESKSFALLGSANLTRNSMENNIEVAMMIYGRGQGRIILRELSRWGLERLRTLEDSKLIKKMKLLRRSK